MSNLFKKSFSFTFNAPFILFNTSHLCWPHGGTRLTRFVFFFFYNIVYCYIVHIQVTRKQRLKQTLSPKSLFSVHRRLFRPKPFLPSVSRNSATIINPGSFSFVMLVLAVSSRCIAYCSGWPISEVVIVTYVQIHVEGFPVAVPIRCEYVLVEGPVHAYGCRKGEVAMMPFYFKSQQRRNLKC